MMDIWEAEPRLASQEQRPAGRMIGRTQPGGVAGVRPAVLRVMHSRKGHFGRARVRVCADGGSAGNPFQVTRLRGKTIAIR